MGKRSPNFKKKKNSAYDTPDHAVWPLIPHLQPGITFAEPCAGKGDLIRHLQGEGFKCNYASDIAPRAPSRHPRKIETRSALAVTKAMVRNCKLIITNPPWEVENLHPMIEHFITLKPTLLLFGADWMHTQQAGNLIKRCSRIISIGRVRWIAGSEHDGMDNCCWYFFPMNHSIGPRFIGRPFS